MMTDAERAGLMSLADDLVKAATSEWQPGCIARAFATPRPGEVVFTMQHWIDLDAVRSPLLLGRLPDIDELQDAAEVFGLSVDALTAEEALDVAAALARTVSEAFAMGLPMRQPDAGPAGADDGFGDWLPLLACLKTQCGFSLAEALCAPVGQALALVAGHRRNQGWEVAGVGYAQRDALQDPEPATLNSEPL